MMARSNARASGVRLDLVAKFKPKVANMLPNVYNNGCTIEKGHKTVFSFDSPKPP